MTEEQRRELERIKNTMGLTDKEAQDYLKGQNVSPEELEYLKTQLRYQMENPNTVWRSLDANKIFKK